MRLGFFCLLLAVGVAACDTAPGAVERQARPVIASVDVTPLEDSLETAAPVAEVPLAVALVLEGAGPIEVRVLVRYAETDTLVASAAERVEPGPVTIAVPLRVPRGATGDYAVSVVTEGPDGRAGDEASARFRFRAASLGPPSVTVEAPAAVNVPAAGSRAAEFPIVVVVTDPDGRENIAAVVLRDEEGFALPRVYDEGPNGRPRGRSDDETAGDGRYSVVLGIPPGFQPGIYTLDAIAVDRSGEVSEPAVFTFEVR